MSKLLWEVTLGIGEGLGLKLLHPAVSPQKLLSHPPAPSPPLRRQDNVEPITQKSRMLTVHTLLQTYSGLDNSLLEVF